MSLVSLAAATRADAPDLVQANLDSRAYHAPWAEPFTDWDGFQRWFAGLLMPSNVGLVARAEGSIVGVVNISEIVRGGFQSAYLGYYGMRPMGGRGLMTEAVRLATRYAFDELGLHRLEANIQPANAASLALAARLGFRREGFRRGICALPAIGVITSGGHCWRTRGIANDCREPDTHDQGHRVRTTTQHMIASGRPSEHAPPGG